MAAAGALWCLQFSPRTAIAINGAVALAGHRTSCGIAPSRIAREAGLPVAEVCGVIQKLQEAGLVKTNGRGTVVWVRDPSKTTLYDIAKAVGERFRLRCWVKGNGVGLCKQCPLEGMSRALKSDVVGLFKARKLSELLTTLN